MIYLQSDRQLPAADDADGLEHFWQDHFHQQQHDSTFAAWIRQYNTAA
jgi:hypothetical protein